MVEMIHIRNCLIIIQCVVQDNVYVNSPGCAHFYLSVLIFMLFISCSKQSSSSSEEAAVSPGKRHRLEL